MKGDNTMKFTKETLRRALRTFLQVAVSYLAANLCVVDFTAESDVVSSAIFGLVVSALAAGIAAVMNLEKIPPVEVELEEDVVAGADATDDEIEEVIFE